MYMKGPHAKEKFLYFVGHTLNAVQYRPRADVGLLWKGTKIPVDYTALFLGIVTVVRVTLFSFFHYFDIKDEVILDLPFTCIAGTCAYKFVKLYEPAFV